MRDYRFLKHKILCLDIGEELKGYPNIYYDHIYKNTKGLYGCLFRCKEHLNNADMRSWYGDWKLYIKEFDTVMIADAIRGRDVIEFIRRVNPNARIIIYYLNSVLDNGRNSPDKYNGLSCELYTFDKKNAREYNIEFRHFFYRYMNRKECKIEVADDSIMQDVFFVGSDKGRLNELMALAAKLEALGITSRVLVERTRHKFYWGAKRQATISRAIPYEDVIKNIRQSKAILDIVQKGQHGLTWRPMEAMCFRKKLITNDPEIESYSFFKKENIFVLGKRSLSELPQFINSDYVPVSQDILDEYMTENWMETFFSESNGIVDIDE